MGRVPDGTADGPVAARIRQRRGGQLHELDRALLQSPPVADGWNTFIGVIRDGTTLPGDLRELAILRVAVLNNAEYEWQGHVRIGRREGLDEQALRVLRTGHGRSALTPAQRVVLAYTDVVTRSIDVDDVTFGALRDHLDNRQVVELSATIAAYNMVSRFLISLRIGETA